MSFRDIIDITSSLIKNVSSSIDTLDNGKSILDRNGYNPRQRSIKARTQNLILQFPVLVSETLSVKTVEMLAETFQYEYCSMIKLALSNDMGELTTNVNNAQDILNNLHRNISNRMLSDSYDYLLDEENIRLLKTYEEKVNLESLNTYTYPLYKFNEDDNPRFTHSPGSRRNNVNISNFSKRVKNEIKDKNGNVIDTKYPYVNSNSLPLYGNNDTFSQADINSVTGSAGRYDRNNINGASTTNDQEINVDGSVRLGPINAPVGVGARVATKRSLDPFTGKESVKRGVAISGNVAGIGGTIALGNKDALKVDDDYEIKIGKSNIESLNKKSPLYVKCDIRKLAQVGYSKNFTATDYTLEFGVKSVLHLLKSDDIIYNLATTTKSDNALFKFVRWTTGELKLFKDLIFDYDYNKKLAKDTRRSDNYWWYKLRRLGKSASFRAKLKTKNIPTPIATLIISKDEMDLIRKKHGVDLYNARIARTVLDQYFLLNFCYIDESAEMIYMFDEFSCSYQAFSFDSIKVKSKDRTSKEDLMDVISLFTRL